MNAMIEETEMVQLVPNLSPAEMRAIAGADQARAESDGRLASLRARPCAKSDKCGKVLGNFRHREDGRKSIHRPLSCNRFDCPHCLRNLTCNLLTRATGLLLTDSADSNRVRVGNLFMWAGSWDDWQAVSKAIRRAGKKCGHMRIRHSEGRCLAVSESSFPGASAILPGYACQLVANAIETMDHVRHAARFLGAWKAPKAARVWEMVASKRDPAAVYRVAVEIGGLTKDLRGKGRFRCLFPASVSADTVAAFWKWIAGGAPCPSLAKGELNSSMLKTGQAAPPAEGHDAGSSSVPHFDEDEKEWAGR